MKKTISLLSLGLLSTSLLAFKGTTPAPQGVEVVRLRSPDPAQVVVFDWAVLESEKTWVAEERRMETPFDFSVPDGAFAAVFRHLEGPTLIVELLERNASGALRTKGLSVFDVTLVTRTVEGVVVAGLSRPE